MLGGPVRRRARNSGQFLPLASALSADEISLGKWQEYAVYSRIGLRAVQEVGLKTGGNYVVDDEQPAGYEAWDHFLVDLGIVLRWLKIGEAKRNLLKTGGVVERVAMNRLDKICRSGAGDVLSRHGDFIFIELDRRERSASRASCKRQP